MSELRRCGSCDANILTGGKCSNKDCEENWSPRDGGSPTQKELIE
tara:strand:- start:369 stop:503 length:135 start_codon:yes stop_codon:yes gene_type:complete